MSELMKVDGLLKFWLSGKENKTKRKRNPTVIGCICIPIFFVFYKNNFQKIN